MQCVKAHNFFHSLVFEYGARIDWYLKLLKYMQCVTKPKFSIIL